jgi:DNA-directed RNA polymerase subunit K/omega
VALEELDPVRARQLEVGADVVVDVAEGVAVDLAALMHYSDRCARIDMSRLLLMCQLP